MANYHIFSPDRVCPLGAHVDHQHGLVTGFAIDKGVDLWFDVTNTNRTNDTNTIVSRFMIQVSNVGRCAQNF